jgi:hypothetical protein
LPRLRKRAVALRTHNAAVFALQRNGQMGNDEESKRDSCGLDLNQRFLLQSGQKRQLKPAPGGL